MLENTANQSAGGRKLPAQWSTEPRYSKNDKTGLFRNFAGFALGTAASPLVYRVGIDIHLLVQFVVPGSLAKPQGSPTRPAPPSMKVDIRSNGALATDRSLGTFPTDENGRVDVILDDNPTQDLYFVVELAIEDPQIRLSRFSAQSGLVSATPIKWVSGARGMPVAPGRFFAASFRRDHVGEHGNPQLLILQDDPNYADPAAHTLAVIRELHEWLYRMTKQDWQGVNGLAVDLFTGVAVSGSAFTHYPTSFSAPDWNVKIEHSHFWDRSTIAHEYAHHVMWHLAGIGLLNFVTLLGKYQFLHYPTVASNPTHALIDGWAEFVELIFGGKVPPATHRAPFMTTSGTSTSELAATL